MNVAIYGGSFDPPHIGHEEIIKQALAKLDIDALFVIPTFLNPFKNIFFTPAKIRLKWVEKLLLSYPKAKLLDYEVKQKRPVPTIETVQYIIDNYKINTIYLIIGADNVKDLEKWKDFKRLKKLVTFVVATRDEIPIPKELQKLQINVTISSTLLRDNLQREFLPIMIADDVIAYNTRKNMTQRTERIINFLDEKKAENIEAFDMREKDYFVDDVIIATTLGQKHGTSLSDYVKKEFKSEGILDIEQSDEWTVIDFGDMLIHLMSPEYRAMYNLEEFLSGRDNKEKYD
jgi:nicotinate-nucleotide adenylyltransferase